MPKMCFSYQPDLPPGTGRRAAAPPGLRRMPEAGPCFSYPADVLRMPVGGCFSYTADVPRRMPAGPCFSYSADAPLSAPPGLRRMPSGTCFRY
jgi:hypothetical protein